jgi:LmbE family N-acetylglucosaminyl deacetylase
MTGFRRPPVSAFWRRAQAALAHDATPQLSTGSALVLTPHPDDETIACGLLLATKAALGQPVSVALATDGGGGWYSIEPEPAAEEIVRLRHGEWHAGLDILGVPAGRRFEFGFPDAGLTDNEAGATERIAGLLIDLAPSQVFVTSPDDLHADHRALARATCRAFATSYGTGPAPALFSYRVYPGAGMWPDGHPGEATLARTALQLVRSVPRLFQDRALELRAPSASATKARAVAVHSSQKRLLDGELRFVWGTRTELFRPLDPASCTMPPVRPR